MISCTEQEINYDSPRGGVSVITEKGEVTTSYLLIQKAKISDSGKYTCLPTHANPSTVNVHVLNGMYLYYIVQESLYFTSVVFFFVAAVVVVIVVVIVVHHLDPNFNFV